MHPIDIGVRLRIADALGYLGWRDKIIDTTLRKCLENEHNFQTRFQLIEAYALLTKNEPFIEERIVKPAVSILIDENEKKSQKQAFIILCKLEYYTKDLVHQIIEQLDKYSPSIKKYAIDYISKAPFIPENDTVLLSDQLKNVMHNENNDTHLRNKAFEALFNLYDILS